jgi:hypothetical protein
MTAACAHFRRTSVRVAATLLTTVLVTLPGGQALAVEVRDPSITEVASVPAPLHIAPGGKGTRSGTSWSNAGDLTDLPRFVAARPAGGEIWVRADAGPYRQTSSITLASGGSALAPVVIKGVDVDGGTSARPLIEGDRPSPYSPGGRPGSEVFKLRTGADNLRFSNIAFRNQGTPFRIAGNISALHIEDVSAQNVRRLLDTYISGTESRRGVAGLALRRVKVDGFSKGVVQLRYDSHSVVLEDVEGDSQRQDRDNFAMGVHLEGTVHDVALRRVRMRNAHDTLHSYWNGDGFSTERGVYNVLFEDTVASGNTDAGYDLKSTSTRLVRAEAEDNARNFRFWSSDTVVTDCRGSNPKKRGGTTSQAQVWLAADAQVHMSNCSLVDDSPATTVVALESKAQLRLTQTSVVRHPEGNLEHLGDGATISTDGPGIVTPATPTTAGTTTLRPPVITSAQAAQGSVSLQWESETDGSYQVKYRVASPVGAFNYRTVGAVKRVDVRGLRPGVKYQFLVRLKHRTAERTSAYSTGVFVVTPPA